MVDDAAGGGGSGASYHVSIDGSQGSMTMGKHRSWSLINLGRESRHQGALRNMAWCLTQDGFCSVPMVQDFAALYAQEQVRWSWCRWSCWVPLLPWALPGDREPKLGPQMLDFADFDRVLSHDFKSCSKNHRGPKTRQPVTAWVLLVNPPIVDGFWVLSQEPPMNRLKVDRPILG